MFSAANNPFDPSTYAEMFTSFDATKLFDPTAYAKFDQSALYAAQQKNMDALVAAQKAAAAGYQDLFEKQVAIFQETMKAAQKQIADLAKSEMSGDTAKQQADLTAKAFETAVANAKDLADAAAKANSDAYEIVKARIEDSVEELKSAIR